ncbi:DUF1080 domain-containing protein [Robertkochia marina]|uniref:DUF1080 domain-containing protein n=1 Tax=Robertkochia marina TaxID=1227945 RepID=A0A4S3M468_9FLAO|nr:DUF1080 domain-containing protein [Robertkochia marina]THD69101.1 DUF1080 domain-containing protein [Robertkochia marina]TRZ44925.1 DUF1080 domain-containing protein [Robertkochia marina]
MKAPTIIACALLLFSCKQEQAASETATTPETQQTTTTEQEPTEPEATEIWEPVPEKVSPGSYPEPPADAIILFNGEDVDAWESADDPDTPVAWTLNPDGSMTVADGSGNIRTKQEFGDIQLHIEWKNPESPRADGQNRGNSGIFLQSLYEVQVLDSYDNPTYVNGQAGAVYKQHPPLVNASKPSGQWQVYDIIYHAPEWDGEGNKVSSATVTVLHNGVLIQDHVTIEGTTEYIGWPKNNPHGKAPLMLQDHNDNSGVSYRNIWVREL